MYKPSDKGKIKKDKVSELIELAKEEFGSITNYVNSFDSYKISKGMKEWISKNIV